MVVLPKAREGQRYKSHEYSNKCPNSNIERVMEVVADSGEGDPEGQGQQACLYERSEGFQAGPDAFFGSLFWWTPIQSCLEIEDEEKGSVEGS